MDLDCEDHLGGYIRELLLIFQDGNGSVNSFLGNLPVRSYKMKYFILPRVPERPCAITCL